MGDRTAEFGSRVARLERRARGRLLAHRALQGLFFGLLPGVALAFLAGTVALPFPAALAAAACAAAGTAVGVASALIARVDRRRLLLRVDEALRSREIISTAQEVSRKPGSAFTEAIVEDAAQLLAGATPRAALGPLRAPFAPFAALAAMLSGALLLFPVDLRALFPPPSTSTQQLAQIGEDLRRQGEKLAEEARARGLDRTLELSQQLAQLGKDLAARRIQSDDALDRMSDLQSGLEQEYQLRLQQAQPASPQGRAGPGPEQPGEPDSASPAAPGDKGGAASSAESEDRSLQDLGDAMNRLRQAQRQLGREGAGRGGGGPARPPRQQDQSPAEPGQDLSLGGGQGQSGPEGQDNPSGPGQGYGSSESPSEEGSSGIGTLPAPEKRGPASSIIRGAERPALQAPGSQAGEGDSARLLARALPEWTGSRLPERTILNQYAQQAESALRHDEVPLKLRQAVKEYFTAIGISK